MPEIVYSGTGAATAAERDTTHTALRDWCNGSDSRTLDRVEHRPAVDAIAVEFRWDVPMDEEQTRRQSLDSFVGDGSRIPADLPLPSDGAATIVYP